VGVQSYGLNGTVLFAAILPLAGTIYLLTTTADSAAAPCRVVGARRRRGEPASARISPPPPPGAPAAPRRPARAGRPASARTARRRSAGWRAPPASNRTAGRGMTVHPRRQCRPRAFAAHRRACQRMRAQPDQTREPDDRHHQAHSAEHRPQQLDHRHQNVVRAGHRHVEKTEHGALQLVRGMTRTGGNGSMTADPRPASTGHGIGTDEKSVAREGETRSGDRGAPGCAGAGAAGRVGIAQPRAGTARAVRSPWSGSATWPGRPDPHRPAGPAPPAAARRPRQRPTRQGRWAARRRPARWRRAVT
jgi:hypothetical protein